VSADGWFVRAAAEMVVGVLMRLENWMVNARRKKRVRAEMEKRLRL